jgi:hypothetical protein
MRKRRRATGPSTPTQQVLPLTLARSTLPALLKQLVKTQGTVGIAVHGRLQGYLLAPKAYEELRARQPGHRAHGRRSALYGSLTLVGDLEAGSRKVAEALKARLRKSAKEHQ